MIVPDYLGFRSLQHPVGCTAQGWQVLEHIAEHATRRREIVIRFVCALPQGCGTYYEWRINLPPDRDSCADPRSGIKQRSGPVEAIGYGTAPIRRASVWLHAGPPSPFGRHGEGPGYYLVTRTAAPPRTLDDVLGLIIQQRRDGLPVKSRWDAAAGYRPGKYGPTPADTAEGLSSRTAAARWIAAATGGPAAGCDES